jgi:signal transduction histidine kinase
MHVAIGIHSRNGRLTIEVVDDGKGGADVSGTGLTGLARRVRALDGKLEVESPEGGPTRLRAELPCGS